MHFYLTTDEAEGHKVDIAASVFCMGSWRLKPRSYYDFGDGHQPSGFSAYVSGFTRLRSQLLNNKKPE
jgi:hypothetical protein